MSRKFAGISTALIVLLAVGLRVWGIRWGLPAPMHYYSYHPDENIVLPASLSIDFFGGHPVPGFYNYGSLFMYLISFAVLLASAWGFINLPPGDVFSRIGEVAKLYMTGRIVAVALGIATVCLVYVLGKRAYGRGAGLLAALFMAVMPIHVMHSKFLAVDVPATFFVTLALVYAVRIPDGHRFRDYLLSGLFAGLAAGTKYNAGLVLLAPIAAHLASGKARPILRAVSPKLMVVLVMAAAGFLIGTPGAVLDYGKFSHDFLFEVWHARTGHGLVFTGTESGLIYHLKSSLLYGMGPLLVPAVIGILYALLRRTPGDLALLVFLAAYYAVIGTAEVKFARYIIPILPAMAVLGARVLADALDRLKAGGLLAWVGRWALAGVLVLTVAGTLVYSTALDEVHASQDTRDSAARWIRRNVPPKSSIGFPTIPWFYTPPVDPYIGMPAEREERYRLAQEYTEYALFVSRGREWSAGFLKRESPDYLVISEFEYTDRRRIGDAAFRRYADVLRREYRLEKTFRNPLPGREDAGWPVSLLPHDMSYASPTIVIFSRKPGE